MNQLELTSQLELFIITECKACNTIEYQYYLGLQETMIKDKYLSLYNCGNCNSTRVYNTTGVYNVD